MNYKLAIVGENDVLIYAAEELKKYLQLLNCNARVLMMSKSKYNPKTSDVIWLGVKLANLPDVKNAELDDAISINICNGTGIITGTNPRSVLIAVYRYLTEMGVSFLRPTLNGEVIPDIDPAEKCVKLCEAADSRHRAVCIEGAVSYENIVAMIDFLPKVGMNGYYTQFITPYTFFNRWYSHQNNPTLPNENVTPEDVADMLKLLVREIKRRGLLYHAVGHGWTCEAFGIKGITWDNCEYNLTDEAREAFAMVNGKRDLWKNVPLNTNLCYSNKKVRDAVTDYITSYCKEHPSVDFLHFWLADGYNNQCECENCNDTIPADFYVKMLNELDEKLTKENLSAKVVFLLYFDLLWEPEHEKLINQDRFVLMFAPITRTYSKAYTDEDLTAEPVLSPYVRNKLIMPKSVSENVARLRRWKKMFDGDSFDFDYHFMWDHFKDPGYYNMAKILYTDMKNLNQIGLNGMVSCQNSRVFFPTGLGFTAMAKGLWDINGDFDHITRDYFSRAFGDGYEVAIEYCQTLSHLFNSPVLRHEEPFCTEENATQFKKALEYSVAIRSRLERYSIENADEIISMSWQYLIYHTKIASLLAETFYYKAKSDTDTMNKIFGTLKEYVCENELILCEIFDVFEFIGTIGRILDEKDIFQ